MTIYLLFKKDYDIYNGSVKSNVLYGAFATFELAEQYAEKNRLFLYEIEEEELIQSKEEIN